MARKQITTVRGKQRLEQQRQTITERVEYIQRQQDQQSAKAQIMQNFAVFCEQTQKSLENPTPEVKQEVLRLLVESVIVEEDAITIKHTIPTDDNGRLLSRGKNHQKVYGRRITLGEYSGNQGYRRSRGSRRYTKLRWKPMLKKALIQTILACVLCAGLEIMQSPPVLAMPFTAPETQWLSQEERESVGRLHPLAVGTTSCLPGVDADHALLETARFAASQISFAKQEVGQAKLSGPARDPAALGRFKKARKRLSRTVLDGIDALYSCRPCTIDGERFQALKAIEFGLLGIESCHAIPWLTPSSQAVNRYLACVHPLNIALVTISTLSGNAASKMVAASCPSTQSQAISPMQDPLPEELHDFQIGFVAGEGWPAPVIAAKAGVDAETLSRLLAAEESFGVFPATIPYGSEPDPDFDLWEQIKYVSDAYPGSLIPRQFEIRIGDHRFLVSKLATRQLMAYGIDRIARTIVSPSMLPLYEQMHLYEFGQALRQLDAEQILYIPPSILDSDGDIGPYLNAVGEWRIGIVEQSNGPDFVHYAAKQPARSVTNAVSAPVETNRFMAGNVTEDGVVTAETVPPAALSISKSAVLPIDQGPSAIALAPEAGTLFVTSSVSDTLSVIDSRSLSVTEKVDLGRRPEDIGVDTQSQKMYVSNGFDFTISVIDTPGYTTTEFIPVDPGPSDIAIHPSGEKLYVAHRYSNTIGIVGLSDHAVERIQVGAFPDAIAMNSETGRAYVTNMGDDTLSVIDTEVDAVIAAVGVEPTPSDIAVNQITNRIYVANADSNAVTVIDGKDNSVIAVIDDLPNPSALATDEVDNMLYVASRRTGDIYAINGEDNKIIHLLKGGTDLAGLAISSDRDKLFAIDAHSSALRIIDPMGNTSTADGWSVYLPAVTK